MLQKRAWRNVRRLQAPPLAPAYTHARFYATFQRKKCRSGESEAEAWSCVRNGTKEGDVAGCRCYLEASACQEDHGSASRPATDGLSPAFSSAWERLESALFVNILSSQTPLYMHQGSGCSQELPNTLVLHVQAIVVSDDRSKSGHVRRLKHVRIAAQKVEVELDCWIHGRA